MPRGFKPSWIWTNGIGVHWRCFVLTPGLAPDPRLETLPGQQCGVSDFQVSRRTARRAGLSSATVVV